MDFNSLLVGGVSVVLLTEVVIKLVKTLWNSSKATPILNVLIAIAVVLVGKYSGQIDLSLVDGIVFGIMSGATTSGLYDFRKDYLRLTI